MRRIIALTTTVVLMLVAFAPAVLAQYEEHPVVGTWIGDPEPDNPDNPLGLTIAHADGTMTAWDPDEGGVGTWAPTGERSFGATLLYPFVDPEAGPLGFSTVRLIGEVSEDGQTSSGTYTVEFPAGPEGVFPPGEFGPGEFLDTRLSVESMGEPVGPWPLPPPPEE